MLFYVQSTDYPRDLPFAAMLAEAREAKSAAELTEILTRGLRKRDKVTQFALHIAPSATPKLTSIRALASYDRTWLHQYQTNDYMAHDPVAQAALGSRHGPILEWGLLPMNARAAQLMGDARGFEISNGRSYVSRGRNWFACLSVCHSAPTAEVVDGMADALYSHLVPFVHAEARRVVSEDDGSGVELTATQRKILGLAAEGLRAQDIADRRGCSLATVRSHLQEARFRLGVESTAAAVNEALAQGLIER